MDRRAIGLAGIGVSGEWTVELDEIDEHQLAISVSHPRVCLQLPPMLEAHVQKLRQSIKKAESVAQGQMFDVPIVLEFTGECFRFRLRRGSVLLELVLSSAEIAELSAAFEEACIDADLT